MDGTGELFAGFAAAIAGCAAPLVISYPVDEVLDYAALTEFARARLPRGQPFVLLGESFSGPVAIALAASEPECIGLVLCCSFARNPVPLMRGLQRLTAFLPISPSLTPAIAPLLLGGHRLPELGPVLASVAPAVMRARLREVLNVDYSIKMAAVSAPVLYLQSIDDRVVPASSARHLQSLSPTMAVVRLPGPHLLLQTIPKEAAAAVCNFIRTLNLPG